MSRAFPPREDCPQVPANEAVSIVPFSFDAEIPPSITQFPLFDFPPADPPSFDFGCYEAKVESRFSASDDDPAKFEAAVSYPDESETGKCAPVFEFDVNIPCVSVAVAAASLSTGIPSLFVAFDRSPTACAYDFSFDLTVPPCADVVVNSANVSMVSGDPAVALTAVKTSEENCRWRLDFDLEIPYQCATITTESSISEDPTPSVDFTAEQTGAPESCTWKLSLDIKVPSGGGGGSGSVCRVRAATVGPVTRSGLQVIDGVSLASGDSVLVKNQADAKDNGAYTAAAGTWDRTCTLGSGSLVSVREGTMNGSSVWELLTDGDIEVGVTPLTFGKLAGCCCSARTVAVENLTLSGLQTVDGASLVDGDVCLAAGQSSESENGPYVVRSGAWERTCEVFSGHLTAVREGDTYAVTIWMLVTDGDIDLETTPLIYRQTGGAGGCEARAATLENIALSDEQTVDGAALEAGDICLVRMQTDPLENGTYTVVKGAAWVRACNYAPGQHVTVSEGYANEGTAWILTTDYWGYLSYQNISRTCEAEAASVGANLTLSGLYALDGVDLYEGDIVLAKDQTDKKENGTYVALDGRSWQRICTIATGQKVSIRDGYANGGMLYELSSWKPNVGIDELEYDPVSSEIAIFYARLSTFRSGYTAPVALSGAQTVDGVVTATGDAVLVRDRVGGSAVNGLYKTGPGAWVKLTMPRSRCLAYIGYGEVHAATAYMTFDMWLNSAGLGAYFKYGTP